MLRWRTVLSFICLHLLTGSVLARSCYYPNGNLAPADVPCGDDESVDTHCCNKGSICLENRLCLNVANPYVLSRQSCTSQDWTGSCPSQCTKRKFLNFVQTRTPALTHSTDTRDGAVSIFLLTEDVPRRQFSYCCSQVESTGAEGANATCIYDDEGPFTIEDSNMLYGFAKLQGVQDPSTNTTSPTPANTTNDMGSSSSHTDNSGNSHKREVAIGAGVGVPLGVIAAAAIAWGFYERMQRRKALNTAAAAPVPFTGELQPMMKDDLYPTPPPPPAGPAPVELEQRNHQVPELQGTPRM